MSFRIKWPPEEEEENLEYKTHLIESLIHFHERNECFKHFVHFEFSKRLLLFYNGQRLRQSKF